MTHNEPRTNWIREGLISLGAGVLYGCSHVVVAHPFDTIKTKMQAQTGYERLGIFQTLIKTVKTGGFIGLYRGCIPPLMGSAIYRSVQFGAFEAVYTMLDNDLFKTELPMSAGLQIRVIIAGMVAGTMRSFIECPLEHVKIKRQIGETWHFKELYRGYKSLLLRAAPLMTNSFIIIDYIRRNHPNLFTYPILGPLVTAGFAATGAWWTIWPLEYVRTQLQAGYGDKKQTRHPLQRLAYLYRNVGFIGLYRGVLPGSLRSFTGSGVAMVVMLEAQKLATQWGLRDPKK